MFKHLRNHLLSALLLSGLGAGFTAPAHAGVPVIDVANLAQAIQQVISWGQQLEGMVQQYAQLQSTYSSLTGPRGMQSLVPIALTQRNYLPATYAQLQGVMAGSSATYAPLAAQVQSAVQSNAVLSSAQNLRARRCTYGSLITPATVSSTSRYTTCSVCSARLRLCG